MEISLCQGLQEYDLECAQLESDVRRCNATLAWACMHYSLYVCIGWTTFASSNVRKHQLEYVIFEQAMLANGT